MVSRVRVLAWSKAPRCRVYCGCAGEGYGLTTRDCAVGRRLVVHELQADHGTGNLRIRAFRELGCGGAFGG